ncbi:MAG: CDP-2,3-bis-(O-geranylgeranyl)-sn-glycerol synthase [Candidatus Micrarchaeota archaeon]
MDILRAILFILPAYFANATPVIFGGGAPVDFGKKFSDGRRVLGDGKTWRGLFAGIFFGTLVAVVIGYCIPDVVGYAFFASRLPRTEMGSGIPPLSGESGAVLFGILGFLLSCGAMFGDLLGSFVKRRMGAAPGQPSFALDQLMFLVFAVAFAWPLRAVGLDEFVFLVVLTYALHVLMNLLANRLGLKKVPW